MEKDSRVTSSHRASSPFSAWWGLDYFTETVPGFFFPGGAPLCVCARGETAAGGRPSGQASGFRAATWLCPGAEPPVSGGGEAAAGTGKLDHFAEAPLTILFPLSGPSALTCGGSATCKLCQRSPAGARGLPLRDSCVRLGVPALGAPSQLPAAAVASRKAESRFPSSLLPRLLQPARGALSPEGWCKGRPPPPAAK